MTLAQILDGVSYSVLGGSLEVEISDLYMDSRKVTNGSAFIAIVGAKSDGHTYLKDVVSKGATALIVSENVDYLEYPGVTVVRVEDTRYAMALMSANFFGHPEKELFTIGITGTKGKTTTTYMIKNVLDACGIPTGLIGTIESIVGTVHTPAANTTPESYAIHKAFREMVNCGMKAVVMEVSSQGLMLHRTAGILFDIGVFTNLEKDHIGPYEHTSMEHYIACKSMLFRQCKKGIVNGDDAHLEAILRDHTCEVETFGLSEGMDYRASAIEYSHEAGRIGTTFAITGKVNTKVELGMPGLFSVYNALCAVAVTSHLKVSTEQMQKALQHVHVKGRIEPVSVSDKFTLLIDYAHNAMALESVLKTLREYHPHRLVTLFGCGGNRSRDRRFEMGEVSGKLSDFTIITSDNPRFEKPEEIIEDIVKGMKKTNGAYITITDRKEAIRYAITHGEPGDIIILAGKGHEDYQEINGVKYPMDERVLIQEILRDLAHKR